MHPTLALETIERSLRQLYDLIFTARYGSSWLSDFIGGEKIAILEEKRQIEADRREKRGVAAVSSRLVDYTEFHQLTDIASKRWDDLSPALGAKREFLPLLDRFGQLRNTVAHNRPLLAFEEDLLSGIAGEIRNKVTIFMSSQPIGNEFWARIEAISDNFGHTVDGLATVQISNPHVLTGKTLRVGDTVTFECRATDPKGRSILWSLSTYPGGEICSATGEAVQLNWTVEEASVGQQTSAQIRMKSDSASHRWPEGNDGLTLFYYQVLPS